jgi:hypothetical protein
MPITPLDLGHLESRMRQSGHLERAEPFDEETFRRLVHERIESIIRASESS